MARNHRTRSKTKFGNCFAHVLQILRSHELDFPHRIPGYALANKDNWNEAIGFYQTALRARPNYIKAHNNLGVALAVTGKTDEAVAQFRESMQILPTHMPILVTSFCSLASTMKPPRS